LSILVTAFGKHGVVKNGVSHLPRMDKEGNCYIVHIINSLSKNCLRNDVAVPLHKPPLGNGTDGADNRYVSRATYLFLSQNDIRRSDDAAQCRPAPGSDADRRPNPLIRLMAQDLHSRAYSRSPWYRGFGTRTAASAVRGHRRQLCPVLAQQLVDELIYAALGALADALADLDGLGNLVIWDADISSLGRVVPEAGMTVGTDGGADGDQFTNAIIELHGGFSFSAPRDEGTPQKDTGGQEDAEQAGNL